MSLSQVLTFTLLLPVIFDGGGTDMNTISLNTTTTLHDVNYVIQRIGNEWQKMGDGLINDALTVALGKDGKVYVGGDLGGAGGFYNMAVWDGTSWTPLPGGGVNSIVDVIIVKPDGNLLVGGHFTASEGGVVLNRLGLYDVTTNTWSMVASGFDGTVFALSLTAAGVIYATGSFDNPGGLTGYNFNNAAKITGSTYSNLGTGLNDRGLTITLDIDGLPIFGGVFTTANGVTVNGIAKWTGTTFSKYGSGVTTSGPAFYLSVVTYVSPAGILYAGGGGPWPGATHTIGGITTEVASWNGASWQKLGNKSPDYGITSISRERGGRIIFSGRFESVDGAMIYDHIASWTGTEWQPLDVDLPGIINSSLYNEQDDRLILLLSSTGDVYVQGFGSLTIDNTGTAPAFPKFSVKRDGGTAATLVSIRNETTGQDLLFNWPMMDGEEIVIDLSGENKTVRSSISGNQLSKVLTGSEFSTFYLAPGVNKISVYVIQAGETTMSGYIQWENEYISIDGSAQ